MIYLLYGTKKHLIQNEIQKLTKSFDNININKYDLDNCEINSFLEECATVSMFDENKLVIGENATILNAPANKVTEQLENYLNNPNPNTTIIFTLYKDKLDERKKLIKLLRKIATIKIFNEEKSIREYIKTELKDYQIDDKNIDLLIDRVGENTLLIKNELNKIKFYKDNKLITQNDILKITHKNIETDIFKLIDYIINAKKENAIEMYYEMINQGEEPIKIVVMLGNQFRLMYQIKQLSLMGYNEKEISIKLKIHPYRAKIIKQNCQKFKVTTLLKYLKQLSDIDYNIKSGKIDKNLALELFILKR